MKRYITFLDVNKNNFNENLNYKIYQSFSKTEENENTIESLFDIETAKRGRVGRKKFNFYKFLESFE
jgi:hypothetical protein